MKSHFDTLLFPMWTLMLGFLSALLLPAPQFGIALSKSLMAMFHFSDLNQMYTLVFCLWFLLLGAVEYWVIRFLWRRANR
ncbi:hypothetical protein CIG19_10100 [Enterobacterales bacterium CwR94]|nr:hypothetical protein CIG19_10100 [Enterobacterales bacterium CwR94]